MIDERVEAKREQERREKWRQYNAATTIKVKRLVPYSRNVEQRSEILGAASEITEQPSSKCGTLRDMLLLRITRMIVQTNQSLASRCLVLPIHIFSNVSITSSAWVFGFEA